MVARREEGRGPGRRKEGIGRKGEQRRGKKGEERGGKREGGEKREEGKEKKGEERGGKGEEGGDKREEGREKKGEERGEKGEEGDKRKERGETMETCHSYRSCAHQYVLPLTAGSLSVLLEVAIYRCFRLSVCTFLG